jgi:hypothetical protein
MAPDPKPQAPKKTVFRYLDKNPVKVATSNLFIDTESVPVDYMVGVVFGSIGGQELINYSMTELSGEENTSPIKDIYKINEKFSSNNILQTNRNSQNSNAPGTPEFTLNLLDYTLEVSDKTSFVDAAAAPDRDIILSSTNVYMSNDWQNLVINLSDNAEGLLLELDFVRFGNTL